MVNLNQLYLLKKADAFSMDVKLRLQRSKEGGVSDQKIGSFFGLFLTIFMIILIIIQLNTKIAFLHNGNRTQYSQIALKNQFD